MLVGLLLLGVSGASAQPKETPTERFELAKNAFYYQDYARSVKLLEPLLLPQPTLPSATDVRQAREMLGASYWFKKNKAGFKQQFTLLLQDEPRFELDAFYYPPEMVADFQELKGQLVELGIIKLPTEELKKQKEVIVIEKTVEKRSFLPTIIPFGVGQFANGQDAKGYGFLSASAVLLATNIGSWLYMYSAQATGTSRDAAVYTMYGSLVALVGVMVWGITDAVVNFSPETVFEEKRMEKRDDSASMLPIPAPGQAGMPGIGFTWTF